MNRRTTFLSLNFLQSFDVDKDMKLTQELSSLNSIYGTVTGKEVYKELKKLRIIYWTAELDLLQLPDCWWWKEHDPQHMSVHCITHQQAFFAKYMDMGSILNPGVNKVNLIRLQKLNHTQFKDIYLKAEEVRLFQNSANDLLR